MRCPNCNSENNDTAKFCKKCGTPLEKKTISHESMINSMSNKSGGDNTTKYIIIALVAIAVVLAGAFVYIYGFGQNQSDDAQVQQEDNDQNISQSEEPAQAQSTQQVQSTPAATAMSILGGSFETGGGLEDKTYASIYVGSEHSGENVKIQIHHFQKNRCHTSF